MNNRSPCSTTSVSLTPVGLVCNLESGIPLRERNVPQLVTFTTVEWSCPDHFTSSEVEASLLSPFCFWPVDYKSSPLPTSPGSFYNRQNSSKFSLNFFECNLKCVRVHKIQTLTLRKVRWKTADNTMWVMGLPCVFSVVIDRQSVSVVIVSAIRWGWRKINCAAFVTDEQNALSLCPPEGPTNLVAARIRCVSVLRFPVCFKASSAWTEHIFFQTWTWFRFRFKFESLFTKKMAWKGSNLATPVIGRENSQNL